MAAPSGTTTHGGQPENEQCHREQSGNGRADAASRTGRALAQTWSRSAAVASQRNCILQRDPILLCTTTRGKNNSALPGKPTQCRRRFRRRLSSLATNAYQTAGIPPCPIQPSGPEQPVGVGCPRDRDPAGFEPWRGLVGDHGPCPGARLQQREALGLRAEGNRQNAPFPSSMLPTIRSPSRRAQ